MLADISLMSVGLSQAVSPFGQAVPVVGEKICIKATYQTSELAANASYRLEFKVDGVPLSATVTSGAGMPAGSFLWVRCGWYASPGLHVLEQVTVDADNAVAEADEGNNTLSPGQAFTPPAPTTLPQKFVNPMGGTMFRDWSIVNYSDVDPTAGNIKDFQGGPITYDGHGGHDLSLPNFAQMDAGVPVYAAANGTVEVTADGNFDRRGTRDSTQPSNFVTISHGSGWKTDYYHFAANTIAVKAGDVVTAGQFLGLAGSSGDSDGAHLHFAVKHNGADVETSYAPYEYFASPLPIQSELPMALKQAIGVTSFVPTDAEFKERPAEQTVFSTQVPQNVTFWFNYSHPEASDHVQVKVYRPDGRLGGTYHYTTASIVRNGYRFWTLPAGEVAAHPGSWRIAVEAAGVEIASRTFDVITDPGVAGMKVTALDGSPIIDNRTTPVDFGTTQLGGVTVGQSFTITNHGAAALALSNLVLPPAFSLTGGFPGSISAGSSANLSINLDTAIAGAKFGAVQLTTNDPDTPIFNFNVSGTVSGDSVAGAPAIGLPATAVPYTALGEARIIAPAAVVTDSDSLDFGGGSLKMEFGAISASDDTLGIRNVGTGPGQIGVSGPSIRYGGVPIGLASGEGNSVPLVVSFNLGATAAAIQELVRNITFNTTAIKPQTLARNVRFTLVDETGKISNLPLAVVVQDLRPTTLRIDAGGNLAIIDTSFSGKDDRWLLTKALDTAILTDLTGNTIDASSIPGVSGNGTPTVAIPFSLLAGPQQIVVESRKGADLLTIDISGGIPVPTGGIQYLGGLQSQAPGDGLAIMGGGPPQTYNCNNNGQNSNELTAVGPVNCFSLAPLTTTGTPADLIIQLPAGPSSVVLEDDGQLGNGMSRVRSVNGTFESIVFPNPTGSLTIDRGSPADTITTLAAPDFTASLTIGSAASPFNAITFAGPLALAADKSLVAAAAGTVSLSGDTSDIAVSGTGSVHLATRRDLGLWPGSSISTVHGNIALAADQQSAPPLGLLQGVVLSGATITSSGAGNIGLVGTAATDATSGSHYGVNIESSVIRSTADASGAGTIAIVGQGGGGTSSGDGVLVQGASGLPSFISTVNGDIQITGTGGIGSATFNRGVTVREGSQITSTGIGAAAGQITIVGLGGKGTDSNIGVEILGTGSLVATADGDIAITGQGGSLATGSFNYGVRVSGGGQVKSTGTAEFAGKLAIVGTGGGTGAAGSNQNQGIRVDGSTTEIGSIDGNLSLTGTGGTATLATNTFADGVRLVNNAQIQIAGAGSLAISGSAGSTDGNVGVALRLAGLISLAGQQNTFSGDRMLLDTANLTLDAGTNTVALRPKTGGTTINLGSTTNSAAGALELSDAELDRIATGTLQIGDASSGVITVSAALTQPAKNLALVTAAGVNGSGDILNGSATATTLTIAQNGDSTYSGSIGGAAGASGSDRNLAFRKQGSGVLTLSGANTFTGATAIDAGTLLVHGSTDAASALTTNNGAVLGGTGNATGAITIASGGRLAPGTSPGILNSGSLSLASGAIVAVELTGTTVGTQYDQANVVGTVSLGGATLIVSLEFAPTIGNTFTIVNNDSTDSVTGTFDGLPEGKVFRVTSGSFIDDFQISYLGGDGNDAVLTKVNVAPSFVKGLDQTATDEDGPKTVVDWATAIVPGSAGESGQELTFLVEGNTNAGLFAAGPAIDALGVLTFTPRPNAHGTATIAVRLHDNGGTAGGGSDTSSQKFFDIVITKPHPWHNAFRSLDVTGASGQPDGVVVAGDAVAIINYINAFGPGAIPSNATPGAPYLDTTGGPGGTGDNLVVAGDALAVINYINAFGPGRSGPEGEGEIDAAALGGGSSIGEGTAPHHADLLGLLAFDIASLRSRRRR